MTRLPRVSGKDTVAALRRGGFAFSHQWGSHVYLRHPDAASLVTVPLGTLRSILTQADRTVDKFIALLKD